MNSFESNLQNVKFNYLVNNNSYQTRLEIASDVDYINSEILFYDSLDISGLNFELKYYDSIRYFLSQLFTSNKNVYLGYSGGIDSEAVLLVAHNEGFNIKPVIVDLFSLNSYDIDFAKKFCQKIGIEPIIITISQKEYLDKYLLRILAETESSSYLLSAQLILPLVLGSSDPIVIVGESPSQFFFCKGQLFSSNQEYSYWPLKFNLNNNSNVYDLFFNSQVFYSYLNHRIIKDRLISHSESKEPWYVNLEQITKECIYEDHRFRSISRRFPMHGWEKLRGTLGYNKGFYAGGSPDSSIFTSKSKDMIPPTTSKKYLNERLGITNYSKSYPNKDLLNSNLKFNNAIYRPIFYSNYIQYSCITNPYSESLSIKDNKKLEFKYNLF